MDKPLAEVGEDDVIRLFRSIQFRRSLKQAATFTKGTGYESAFRVIRDFYLGSYYVSRILEGTTENFATENRTYAGELADFDFGEQTVPFDCCYRFLNLHFHPDITKCPIPSYPDLLTSQTSLEDWEAYERVDVRPIIGVAHVLQDDRIVTLLYQKSIRGDIEQTHAFRELKVNFPKIDFVDPLDVVDYLDASGLFHADILTLEKKHAYRPDEKDYNKLRRFAHTPKRQSIISRQFQAGYIDL